MRRSAPRRRDRRSELARATIEVVASVGYDATTIAEIAARAGVVPRTFTRWFADKQAAFEYGYREASEELRAVVQAAFGAGRTPLDRVRISLQAIADFLAADPPRARVLIIDRHAAGPGPVAAHDETMRRMVRLIMQNAAELAPPGGDARLLAETAAGGIYEVVYARTLRGEVATLPDLVPEWVAALVAPYVAIAEFRANDGPETGAQSPCGDRARTSDPPPGAEPPPPARG